MQKIWQSQNHVMGEGLLVEKQLDDFSCILAMVTPFVWIKVLLHLVSFPIPTHLLWVRQTTCLSSPGSFSADGPSGPQQEGQRTTDCSPQRCNSCTEIWFYHSKDSYKYAAPAKNYFLITLKTSTKQYPARKLTPVSLYLGTRAGLQWEASSGFAQARAQNILPRPPYIF